jgi:hypothetical protein
MAYVCDAFLKLPEDITKDIILQISTLRALVNNSPGC